MEDRVKRHKNIHLGPGKINNKKRNLLVEKEGMSKLFTIDRKKQAKKDFEERREYEIQKRNVNKRKLDEKYNDHSFTPTLIAKNPNSENKNPHPYIYDRGNRVVKRTLKNNNNTTTSSFNHEGMSTGELNSKKHSQISKKMKKNTKLGKNTHLKKIEKLKQEKMLYESKNTHQQEIGEGEGIETINCANSITNNNSLESLHQKLKDQDSELNFQHENSQIVKNSDLDKVIPFGYDKRKSDLQKKSNQFKNYGNDQDLIDIETNNNPHDDSDNVLKFSKSEVKHKNVLSSVAHFSKK